jgi:sugar/nucleoside kinase (ribokinase family)
VAAAQLVKASDDDVTWLYPGESLDAVAARWLDLGAVAVVITRGERGALAFRPGARPVERPSRKVEVVDTIGAGDAFTAGLLSALARAGVHGAAALAAAELTPAPDEAILVAALTCERAGADPPTAAEVAARRQVTEAARSRAASSPAAIRSWPRRPSTTPVRSPAARHCARPPATRTRAAAWRAGPG